MRNRIILSLAIVLLTSCTKKAEGQSVAIVNGEEITAAELNSEIASANLPPNNADRAVRSRVLQAIIDRRLLVQQARKQGIDKTPEFVSKERRLTDDLLISMLVSRQMGSSTLPNDEEIAQFQASRPELFAGREFWTLDQIQYDTAAAKSLTDRIARADTMEQLAALLSQAGVAFQRTRNRMDTALIPHDLYAKIAALPSGQAFVMAFPTGGKSVASVLVSREQAPRLGEEAKPIAVKSLRETQSSKMVDDQLKELRRQAEIEYQDGFGPDVKKK